MKIANNVPKTVANWCKRNADKITDVDYGGGYYCEGNAYDILLARGWCTDDVGLHTIIECNAKDTLEKLRNIAPCECRDCETGEGW